MTLPMKADTRGTVMESVIVKGDISKLSPEERAHYYTQVCNSMGLNPLTQPLEYIVLNGKMRLYAKKDATDQLRKINKISLEIVSQDVSDGMLSVHVRARTPDGRSDEDLGVVALSDLLKGEARANQILKAITKAKRRVTLSISGLGFLDELEVDDIPAQHKRPVAAPRLINAPTETITDDGEIIEESPQQSPSVADEPKPAASKPPGDGAAGKVRTAAEYTAHWQGIIDAAKNAKQLHEAWAADKPARDPITWSDENSFGSLKTRVQTAIENLKAAP